MIPLFWILKPRCMSVTMTVTATMPAFRLLDVPADAAQPVAKPRDGARQICVGRLRRLCHQMQCTATVFASEASVESLTLTAVSGRGPSGSRFGRVGRSASGGRGKQMRRWASKAVDVLVIAGAVLFLQPILYSVGLSYLPAVTGVGPARRHVIVTTPFDYCPACTPHYTNLTRKPPQKRAPLAAVVHSNDLHGVNSKPGAPTETAVSWPQPAAPTTRREGVVTPAASCPGSDTEAESYPDPIERRSSVASAALSSRWPYRRDTEP